MSYNKEDSQSGGCLKLIFQILLIFAIWQILKWLFRTRIGKVVLLVIFGLLIFTGISELVKSIKEEKAFNNRHNVCYEVETGLRTTYQTFDYNSFGKFIKSVKDQKFIKSQGKCVDKEKDGVWKYYHFIISDSVVETYLRWVDTLSNGDLIGGAEYDNNGSVIRFYDTVLGRYGL